MNVLVAPAAETATARAGLMPASAHTTILEPNYVLIALLVRLYTL